MVEGASIDEERSEEPGYGEAHPAGLQGRDPKSDSASKRPVRAPSLRKRPERRHPPLRCEIPHGKLNFAGIRADEFRAVKVLMRRYALSVGAASGTKRPHAVCAHTRGSRSPIV